MNKPSTDTTLWDWRYGQTQAERLCADILQVDGFSSIDPQCPLGGPDGRKDILCMRQAEKWLAAVYFPPTRSDFKDVTEKFRHDFEGVKKHERAGFAFFTNQPITPGQRAELVQLAEPTPIELYHQERIRSILDSPKGYGLRLEYLRIPMTEEDQHSLWSTLKDDLTARLTRQEVGILELHRKMDMMMARTMEIATNLVAGRSSMSTTELPRLTQFPTAGLSVGDILWIHRIICDESNLPHVNRGRFRSVSVWIGQPGSTPETARYIPPSPAEIGPRLDDLLSKWRGDYPAVSGADEKDRLSAIATFHHGFLSIHPFLDANGRVARAILQQQVLELTDRHITATFTDDPTEYFAALAVADKGNLKQLELLIAANLE